MKFTAQIVVEVEADSFAQAAEHERHIQTLFEAFRERYGSSRLEIKQKRAQAARTERARAARPRHTGKLAVYTA